VSTQYLFPAFALFNQIFVNSSTHSSLQLNLQIFHLETFTSSIATNRPIEDWNVSNISDMSNLFAEDEEDYYGYWNNPYHFYEPYAPCNPNLSRWDVSKVTNFVSDLNEINCELFITCKLN
jgi:hypothetical protein